MRPSAQVKAQYIKHGGPRVLDLCALWHYTFALDFEGDFSLV